MTVTPALLEDKDAAEALHAVVKLVESEQLAATNLYSMEMHERLQTLQVKAAVGHGIPGGGPVGLN